MIKRALLCAVLVLATVPAYAGFNEVVRAVEARTGLRRMSLPMIGLARFAVWVIHPSGVHDFQIATFEGSSDAENGSNLSAIMAASAGRGFQPLVQARSEKRREWTYIYARPHDENTVELLIATRDKSDTVVVRVVLDVDKMFSNIHDPHSMVRVAAR